MELEEHGKAKTSADPELVLGELERILRSEEFAASPRITRFLRYVVEQSLVGGAEVLKEYTIGIEVFDRPPSFDPRNDTIVRVQARRLRERLRQFYSRKGYGAAIRIEIPKGGYVPEFHPEPAATRRASSGPLEGVESPTTRDLKLLSPRFDQSSQWTSQTESITASQHALLQTSGGLSRVAQRTRPRIFGGRTALLLTIPTFAVGMWFFTIGNSRSPVLLPSIPLTDYSGIEREPALSPDGAQVAFIWNGVAQGNYDVYTKRVPAGPPVRLTTDPVTESCPVWSPDSRLVAFLRPRQEGAVLVVVPAAGGTERELAKLSVRSHGLTWSPDGKFLAVEDRGIAGEPEGIVLVSASNGMKHRVTLPSAPFVSDRWPAFSPDGRTLAFCRGQTNFGIYLLPLSPEGEPTGEPKRLTESFFISGLDWTPDGRALVFGAIIDGGAWNLWKVATKASAAEPERLGLGDQTAQYPSVARQQSRGRARLAYVTYSSDSNIYSMPGLKIRERSPETQQPIPTRILGSNWTDTAPQFSPAGDRLAFISGRSGHFEVWVADSDGSNPMQVTSFGGPAVGSPRWSPDGRSIAFDAAPEGHADVYIVNPDGGVPRRLTTDRSNEGRASWSRDGLWIYFVSDREGPPEIWKVPVEGGPSVQITPNRGHEAFESPDGRWVYYAKRYAARGEPGIWRIPIEGGVEERVLEEGVAGRWALSRSGIYILNPGGPSKSPAIEWVPFEILERVVIAEFGKDTRFGTANSLTVSLDDHWIAFVRYDHTEADLKLIEQFR